MCDKMANAETQGDDFDEGPNAEGRGELCDVLCQFTTGDALGLVRATADMKGYEAWRKIHKHYNPKTMARAVRMLADVTSPPKVKELGDVEVCWRLIGAFFVH